MGAERVGGGRDQAMRLRVRQRASLVVRMEEGGGGGMSARWAAAGECGGGQVKQCLSVVAERRSSGMCVQRATRVRESMMMESVSGWWRVVVEVS